MSTVTVCTINMYIIHKMRLVHWNRHYDLVPGKISALKEPPKAQRSGSEVITIGFSLCKIELDVSKLKTENPMQIKKEILACSLSPPSERLCIPESADLLDIESDGEDVEMIE